MACMSGPNNGPLETRTLHVCVGGWSMWAQSSSEDMGGDDVGMSPSSSRAIEHTCAQDGDH